MPATLRPRPRCRFALAPAVFLFAALGLVAHAQQLEPKKVPDPKAKDSPIIKLPDGTYLWVGASGEANGERVTLTPQELQKLLDQLDQLRKQLATKKAAAPSGCVVRGRVEKRGEQLVAVLKLTCTFRTTAPQTAVALGGRRGFLVAAALDGNKLPVLDTTEDGFALLVETVGDHSLTLDIDAPITARGTKPELGFEIGLPRAPITTLLFDAPGPTVKTVNITTKTLDPTQPTKAPEVRRHPAFDLKQLAPKPGQENGFALGPIDSLEVSWDPPAAGATQPADQVQSADLDVQVQLTEGVVETTAKVRFRGPAREWKLVAPANADLSAERASTTDVGPALPVTITKPTDPNKPVWKIELPAGSTGADWIITAVTRQQRAKADDPGHRGPFAVGPFTTLDVLRQTGTVRVTASANTHFAFRHGPDLRKAEPPGPVEDEVTTAFFRLTTGPTGTTPVNAPMFSVEARPQAGAVKVKPTYKLSLTDAGWRIRAEVRVFPIRTEINTLAIDVPADWRGLEVTPPELVEGVQPGALEEGFWAATGARLANGLRVPVLVRLAAGHKQPFDLILTATLPNEAGDVSKVIPLPRFPSAVERETSVTATVPEGYEIHGETRDWDGEFGIWGAPLSPSSEAGPKSSRAVLSVSSKSDAGFSRVTLGWTPHRPDLTADVRADVILRDRQMIITQQIKLRSLDGLSRQVRLRGPVSPAALKSTPTLDPAGPGEWTLTTPPDAREISVSASFAVSISRTNPTETIAKVPVAFLWVPGATRAETTVRVWSDMDAGHAIATSSTGWREMPVEPSPDRESLPALTLTASGGESLVLDVQPTAESGAVAVWADRGLVQAWNAGDGAVSYRARFVLRRWLTPTVEIRLPGPLAGPNPEFLRDGKPLDAVPVVSSGEDRAFRVPLPPSRPGATIVLEVRYQLSPSRGRLGELVYQPPTLSAVAFSGPIRWQVIVPPGNTPLLSAGASAEFRWRLRPLGIVPASVSSAESLDWWFANGEEVGDDAENRESVTARQTSPEAITVYRVPHLGLIIVCSVAVFILILLLWRLPGSVFGLGVGLVGVGAVFAAMSWPHPVAQFAGACQPGIAAAAVALCLLSLARWFHRRRVTRMPGFSQSLPAEHLPAAPPVPSSARNRPGSTNSPGHVPAPTGG